jgi:hypothetical protein
MVRTTTYALDIHVARPCPCLVYASILLFSTTQYLRLIFAENPKKFSSWSQMDEGVEELEVWRTWGNPEYPSM